MMISRRTLLVSASAAAIVPALPKIALPAPITAVEAVKPATTIWVGGHNGEFDWQPINAETRQEAMRELIASWEGIPDGEVTEEDLARHDLCLERADSMDGLQVDEIKPYDWVNAGLGACCDRCGGECFAPDGARAINGQAICEECLTIPDLLDSDQYDQELAKERLTEWLMNHDCDEASVRKQMSRDFDPDLIPVDLWQKCLADARAEL
ncbi:hypothetical protein NKZ03_26250 [Sinorhizobium meliloti]|uniref:hypothetical protein n=1 Tax=Rhizobium meliloti TaxID=382 RepID=UPI003D64F68A